MLDLGISDDLRRNLMCSPIISDNYERQTKWLEGFKNGRHRTFDKVKVWFTLWFRIENSNRNSSNISKKLKTRASQKPQDRANPSYHCRANYWALGRV